MSNIKSLADKLRSTMNEPATKMRQGTKMTKEKTANGSHAPPDVPPILEEIRSFDTNGHKSMVHARFDERTLQTMNQLKIAAGVDVTRLVSFSVGLLFRMHPELKTIIKQFFQKLDE